MLLSVCLPSPLYYQPIICNNCVILATRSTEQRSPLLANGNQETEKQSTLNLQSTKADNQVQANSYVLVQVLSVFFLCQWFLRTVTFSLKKAWVPQVIYCDFEKALRKGCLSAFANICLSGDAFHFIQANVKYVCKNCTIFCIYFLILGGLFKTHQAMTERVQFSAFVTYGALQQYKILVLN